MMLTYFESILPHSAFLVINACVCKIKRQIEARCSSRVANRSQCIISCFEVLTRVIIERPFDISLRSKADHRDAGLVGTDFEMFHCPANELLDAFKVVGTDAIRMVDDEGEVNLTTAN